MRGRQFFLVRMALNAPFYGVEYYVLAKRSYRDVDRNPLRKLFVRAPLGGLTLRGTMVGICNLEGQKEKRRRKKNWLEAPVPCEELCKWYLILVGRYWDPLSGLLCLVGQRIAKSTDNRLWTIASSHGMAFIL